MEPVNSPNKKYDWSKAWIDRFYVLNSLLADFVFGVIAFAVAKGAELGARELSGTIGQCPELGHLEFAIPWRLISCGGGFFYRDLGLRFVLS
jgi:cytochrome bd-type quinol oxidase subunit 2